jgi:hypothetical protein
MRQYQRDRQKLEHKKAEIYDEMRQIEYSILLLKTQKSIHSKRARNTNKVLGNLQAKWMNSQKLRVFQCDQDTIDEIMTVDRCERSHSTETLKAENGGSTFEIPKDQSFVHGIREEMKAMASLTAKLNEMLGVE